MRRLPVTTNERVLVGFDTSDDAGVFVLRDDLAIVQTVDFFTPIVDDPYDFGRIAAANALSDIYAMGGTPLTALNIAAFPDDLDLAILERILEGGASIAQQAGVAILGGHTIKDDEPKYGMAVTGTIDPKRIVKNAGAKPGDVLILTKPIGTGILSTALKRDVVAAEAMDDAVVWMTTLNDGASRAMLRAGAHAATDITGFGLLGHASEMARASNARIVFHSARVPMLANVRELVTSGAVPGGTQNNAARNASFTTFDSGVDDTTRLLLSDAQTSGGLLIAVAPDAVDSLREDLRYAGVLDAVVGEVHEGSDLHVTP